MFTEGLSGLEVTPGISCQQAVGLCQQTPGYNGSCSNGQQVDSYWLIIKEYDPITCDFIRTIADGSNNPTPINNVQDIKGANLNIYVQKNWIVNGVNPPWQYFVPGFPAITVNGVQYSASPLSPMTYEVILYIENACGIASSSPGFFTNTNSACLTSGGDYKNLLLTNPLDNITDPHATVFIHPNPVSDIVTINLELDKSTLVNMKLFDNMGQLVQKFKWKNLPKGVQSIKVNLGGFPSGVYYLSLLVGSKHFTGEILKK